MSRPRVPETGTARRIALFLLMLAVFAGPAPPLAAAPEDEAAEAARLYDTGDHEAAAALWRDLLADPGGSAAGLDRAALQYNLGNAEFRAGRLGRAMLRWERTLLLRPGDEDALANLALARRLLDRRLTEAASSGASDAFASELLRSMEGLTARVRRIPARRSAALLSGASLASGGLLTLLLLGRGGGRRRIGVLLALAVLAALGSGLVLRLRLDAPPVAVVVRPGAALRSGPAASFPQLASLPEGFYLEMSADRPGAETGFRRVVAAGIVGYADEESVVPVAEEEPAQ